MEQRVDATIGLYLRVDPRLHAEVKRAAAARQETVARLVRRSLKNELQRVRTGRVVAEAIRRGSSDRS